MVGRPQVAPDSSFVAGVDPTQKKNPSPKRKAYAGAPSSAQNLPGLESEQSTGRHDDPQWQYSSRAQPADERVFGKAHGNTGTLTDHPSSPTALPFRKGHQVIPFYSLAVNGRYPPCFSEFEYLHLNSSILFSCQF